MSKVKALVLFSGGLDSLLAIKILELQDIEVTGLSFASNFFSSANAQKTAAGNNVNLRIVDISEEVLNLVKNPPNGYGKNMNPCIDCHSLMLKKAAEIMKSENYNFIATGEVLGQRPFSQNKEALNKVKKISDVDVLRPLSAKLLEETEIEKKGLVNRGKLLSISGRNRERQMELAAKLKLTYPSPAGGCLLTDPEFSQRLIKMLDYWPDCTVNDAALLNRGRIFWFNNGSKNKMVLAVVGRDEKENMALEKLAIKGDSMVELYKENGPTTLIRRLVPDDDESSVMAVEIPEKISPTLEIDKKYSARAKAAILTGFYATKMRGKKAEIKISFIK